ncbi:MAG TPA: histidinol-phosphate transaminase [Acidimicrobiales bacterium]|nr:histidinol-phosphate transaminase [Acidimicrobiales bacterium]
MTQRTVVQPPAPLTKPALAQPTAPPVPLVEPTAPVTAAPVPLAAPPAPQPASALPAPDPAPPASRRLPKPRADLGLREGYHSAQLPVEVRLNTNESPYPPPAEWLEAVIAQVRDTAFNRYPDRAAWALREALAELHGARPEQVFAANGSNEVLQSICLAYGGAARVAAMWEPTYALHSHIAHLTGTEVVQGQRGADFLLDPVTAVELVEKVRPSIVFLCSPNNPTGLAEDRATVTAVLAAAPGLVVLDEAYGQFSSWSALELVGDEVPLAVVRTYSKTWSLAGLRLGYMVGPAEVVKVMERVALPYHLDSMKQAAGRLALQFSAQMEQRVAAIVDERQRLIAELSRFPVKVWPSQANFVLWRPLFTRRGQPVSGAQVWQGLVERSVLVRDTSSWPGLEGCLRTTVGTPAENDRFLGALSEVLA